MRLENPTALSTLVLSCSLLALSGCPGDDGPAATTNEDGTGTGTTGMVTSDDVDTTSSPMDTTTDGPMMTTGGDETSTGEETGPPPDEVEAFRFTEMFVRDPHFYVSALGGLICADVTDNVPTGDPSINDQFNDAINSDDPMMPDGNLDLSLVLLFRPLDQADAAAGDMDFANAVCTVPPIECDLQEGTDFFQTTYVSMSEGTCLEPDPAHLSPAGYNPQPGTTTGPCFTADPTDVIINTGDFSLPLGDAVIAAQYEGDPADGLVSGTLRGFLSLDDAEATMLPREIQMQTGASVISELLPGGAGNCADHDDMDGDGWWMYVDFEARRVPWVGN